MQDIDVHSEFKNCVVLSMDGHMPPEGRTPGAVTLLAMSKFFNLLGASRVCVDFRDPAAFLRITQQIEYVQVVLHDDTNSRRCHGFLPVVWLLFQQVHAGRDPGLEARWREFPVCRG